MNREEKTVEVKSLAEKFQKSSIAILTEYRGLNASEITELRGALRKEGNEMVVAKNRLAVRSIAKKDHEPLSEFLKGPTAIVFGAEDNPVSGAKTLVDFTKEHEKLVIKQAFLDGRVLEAKDVKELSQLPSKEELLGRLVGSLAAPASGFARTVNGVAQKVVTVLKAISDNKKD